jgi:hypothetical protein
VEAATGGVRGKSSDEGGGGTDTDGEKKEAEGLGWAAGSRGTPQNYLRGFSAKTANYPFFLFFTLK